MKKILLFMIPVVMLVLLITSCKKDSSNDGNNNTTPTGTWSGTGQYGTVPGNPTYVFTLKFNAGGTVDITGNNNTAVDIATGTWQLVADSVKATYKYSASSAIYRLSGKFSASSNVMVGTIGLDPITTGAGVFTVTRQ